MKDYLAQWRYLDGSEGQESFADLEKAKSLVCRRIHLMGGLGCIVRISDWVTVYRLWVLKEDEQHAAA